MGRGKERIANRACFAGRKRCCDANCGGVGARRVCGEGDTSANGCGGNGAIEAVVELQFEGCRDCEICARDGRRAGSSWRGQQRASEIIYGAEIFYYGNGYRRWKDSSFGVALRRTGCFVLEADTDWNGRGFG